MKLSELLARAGLTCRPEGAKDPEIKGISTDSRRAGADELFVCIRGLRSDSHRFIGEAAANGAAAVLADDDNFRAPDGVTTVYTTDSRAALSRLWNAWYYEPAEKLKLIAVTGTNGKTTVTRMLDTIFRDAGKRCGIIGTVETRTPKRRLFLGNADACANMTTPDPEQLFAALAAMRDDGAEYVFMEASSHALALRKLEGLRFCCSVFTNLTPEHLDFHGDMERYFLAKAELLRLSDTVIVNEDDAWGARLGALARKNGLPCRMLTASERDENADFSASRIREDGARGIAFLLRSRETEIPIRCPVPGHFSVMNSLEAAACALECGIGTDAIAVGLAGFPGAPGRMERVPLPPELPAVFIDYAHTPDALENILTTARKLTAPEKRLWAVFGCGGDRDRTKRPVMGEIASRLADVTVLTGDNSRSERTENIIAGIVPGIRPGSDAYVLTDRRDAIRFAVEHAAAGDTVILAGKGHERYEINASGRFPFDEREEVRRAARQRLG